MLRPVIAALGLRTWQLERWLQRRRRMRWLRHYRQAIELHSNKSSIEAAAMAHSRLIDAPESRHCCPTQCALEDLGHPMMEER
ncbi:MAG: hypothetical protein ACQEXC_14230 [Pseudomonadota bacterium]